MGTLRSQTWSIWVRGRIFVRRTIIGVVMICSLNSWDKTKRHLALVALVTLLPLLPCSPVAMVALLPWLPCCPGCPGCPGCPVALLPLLPCCLVALVALVALLLCCLVALGALLPTIRDKAVESLFLNRIISENKRIRTPPLSPPFKVGVFVVFYRQLEKGHNIAQRGWGRKAIFPPFGGNKT